MRVASDRRHAGSPRDRVLAPAEGGTGIAGARNPPVCEGIPPVRSGAAADVVRAAHAPAACLVDRREEHVDADVEGNAARATPQWARRVDLCGGARAAKGGEPTDADALARRVSGRATGRRSSRSFRANRLVRRERRRLRRSLRAIRQPPLRSVRRRIRCRRSRPRHASPRRCARDGNGQKQAVFFHALISGRCARGDARARRRGARGAKTGAGAPPPRQGNRRTVVDSRKNRD
ncbi:hypothetical protein [Vulcaniibacterium tengchongense]|uniref:hypothetical protein n=1 Tax=Vulcaniibacterium tengchongense TaxID=1273429 RepID=UPI000F507C37|nr:hypothetical protein [Vulcaniibacterium tengchongense]